jgi:anti-anti-sigma factor
VELSVSVHHDAGAATVTVAGDIDLACVGRVEDEIAAALDAADVTDVVVDLSAVTFMDSTGISALLKGRRLADMSGKRYRIAGADGLVRDLLDLTGVWAHLSGSPG